MAARSEQHDFQRGIDKLHPAISADDNPLSRQMTIPISPELYERLFFQPTPAQGDLAKRLGNPTLLGLLGFLIPFQTTMFCLLSWRGSDVTSTVAVSGMYYFLGGIAMNLAGIFEFILGNTFPCAVFIIYGCHWCQVGFSTDPAHNLVSAFEANGGKGALSLPFNAGGAFYQLTMMFVSLVLFFGSLRTSGPFALSIFCLIPYFAFLAAADWYIGYNPTPAGVAHAFYLLQIGGGFGFITALCGWYLAIITACASTGVPCPLPIFDLSQIVFPANNAAKLEHAGAHNRDGSKA